MAKPIKHSGKWRIRWFDENGNRRSEVHDDHNAAKVALARHEAHVDEVRRGLRSPDPPDKSFEDLCDLWLEKRAPKKRSAANDASVIKQLKRKFSGMSVRNIGVEDVDDYVDSRDDLEPKTIANHITLLISMLNYASRLKVPWLARVPSFRKPRTIASGKDFRYLRNEDEKSRFLRAAREEGEMTYMLYKTALDTGMRAGELAGLEWGDVDFENRIILVQRSFDGPTKSGDARPVPILDSLLTELKAWKLRHPGRLLFANRDGGMLARSGRIFQEVLHRVLAQASFPTAQTRSGREVRYITFHGLRHTFASHWMMRGGTLFKLQRILGHQSIQMTERYSHLSPSYFSDDYDRLGGATGPGAVVVALPNRRLN